MEVQGLYSSRFFESQVLPPHKPCWKIEGFEVDFEFILATSRGCKIALTVQGDPKGGFTYDT